MEACVRRGVLAFSHILVPLDGSIPAERALPYAALIAQATGSPLLLVHVVPDTAWAVAVPASGRSDHPPSLADERAAVLRYLRGMVAPLRAAELHAEALTLHGDPVDTLIDLQCRASGALLVMATHGRWGMARFALGAVTDPVVRAGLAPVLLVRPFGANGTPALERALVPLDGTPVGELALDMVARLAGPVRHVTLLRAVDRGAGAARVGQARHDLERAAASLGERLAGRSCTVEIAVVEGDAVQRIVERASHGCDLLVLPTHGHLAADRWAHGSTADRVLHGADVPVLLLRPPEAA